MLAARRAESGDKLLQVLLFLLSIYPVLIPGHGGCTDIKRLVGLVQSTLKVRPFPTVV